MIIGVGETDDSVLEGVEEMAKMGVVANLRALRINEMNRPRLTEALGFEPGSVDGQRLKILAEGQKAILEKYDLTTLNFKTMCFSCQCCDVVPFRDL